MRSNDENTPLLQEDRPATERRPKPNSLPWGQLSIILLVRVCDALTKTSTHPYINKLVSELDIVGGDPRKVGYYIGLMDSLSSAAFALTVFHWNRLSDYVGRKPILLVGMLGSAASMLSFGLSRTFWALTASQCMGDLLNGNTGVVKSSMGEITNSRNRAQGYALLTIVWAVGGSAGSFLGGVLAKPSSRFPRFFDNLFWRQYPYFLPCLAVSTIVVVSSLITIAFLKESAMQSPATGQGVEETLRLSPRDKPPPLRQLLVFPVLVPLANYMSLLFLSTCFHVIHPLFLTMPIEIGGLGFDTAHIGYILSASRIFNALFLATCFAPIVHFLGKRLTFVISMSSFLLSWLLFPMINLLARHDGISMGVWAGVIFMLLPANCMEVAYALIFAFITESVPTKRSLGTIHGFAQTTGSVARVLAPAMAGPLFSFSVERNILGGYGVYAIFFVLSCPAILLALQLPSQGRAAWEQEETVEQD